MNGIQKGIKIFAIALAIFIIMNIVGAILVGLSIITNVKVVEENLETTSFSKIYEGVDRIEIGAVSANLIIQSGEELKVEANHISNKLSPEVQNNTLKIKESEVAFGIGKTVAGDITITIPKEIILSKLKIDAGAGKIQISDITVDDFDIDQGARRIRNCKFQI